MTQTEGTGAPQAEGTAARIIPPAEHPITVDMIDPDALLVMRKLNKAGFSAYLVGGGVRDLYLGKKPKDFDISTDARPGQIRKLFPNSNTIGRRFRLVQVFFRHGKVIEVSTLRSLSEHDLDGPEAVLAPNNTFGTLDEDAQRRDLSINSLFYEIENNTIIDYVDGVQDLDNCLIRIVGDPEKRINGDPVRMIRAIRHSARNNFAIEPESWETICRNHAKLLLCPPSRLRDETLKDIYSGAAAPWFNLAAESGIFLDLFPIYGQEFDNGSGPDNACRGRLARIFTVIDRINARAVDGGVSRQPDFFMLALILLPWAESRYRIYTDQLAGPALFQVGKRIREDLDQQLGRQLNLRRSLRQDIAGLLINLAQLIHNEKDGSWPKWLRKKSYFKRGVLFYHCYREATTGEEAPADLLGTTPNTHISPPEKPQKHSDNKRNRPAFSPKSKGGVFGLSKKRHS